MTKFSKKKCIRFFSNKVFFFLYWCFYPHRSTDSVSPVCGIFQKQYQQHFIPDHKHHPPLLGIGSVITPGVLHTPSVRAGFWLRSFYGLWAARSPTASSCPTPLLYPSDIGQLEAILTLNFSVHSEWLPAGLQLTQLSSKCSWSGLVRPLTKPPNQLSHLRRWFPEKCATVSTEPRHCGRALPTDNARWQVHCSDSY